MVASRCCLLLLLAACAPPDPALLPASQLAPPCLNDADLDGVCDELDLCPGVLDRDGGDADGDGRGDACDPCPYYHDPTGGLDQDGDGLPAACDPCPGRGGPLQADLDQDRRCDDDPADLCYGDDGYGDVDGDGLCNVEDIRLNLIWQYAAAPATDPAAASCAGVQRQVVVWTSSYTGYNGDFRGYELWGRALDAAGKPVSASERLTWFEGDDYAPGIARPTVACNTTTQTFVVLMQGDSGRTSQALTLHLDADARPIGPLRAIPTHGPPGSHATVAEPTLAYDPVHDRFLALYVQDEGGRQPLYGWLLDGSGAPLGTSETLLVPNAPARALTWSPPSGAYVLAYTDGAGGEPHVSVSTVDPVSLDLAPPRPIAQPTGEPPLTAASQLSLTTSDSGDRLLVTWTANLGSLYPAPQKREVFGHLLAGDLSPLGYTSRLSHTGSDRSSLAAVQDFTAAWDERGQRFLVAWSADPATGDLLDNQREIYGRQVTRDGLFPTDPQERLTLTAHTAFTGVRLPHLLANPALGGATLLYFRDSSKLYQRFWGRALTPDTDNDGVRDPIDPCPGPNDLDRDGRADCLTGDPLGDCAPTDPSRGPDADNDGLCDPDDPCPWSASDDADNDGRCDNLDLCLGDDATADADGDGTCDDRDPCPFAPTDDLDQDGLCDDLDPCFGDHSTGDGDQDGTCDDRDLCPGHDDRLDADLDGLPDACDPCLADPSNDADLDGVCDRSDPCVGDNTTGDADGDGTCDDRDPCPLAPTDDADGDGRCDAPAPCLHYPDDADGDGLCDLLDPCFGDQRTLDLDGDGLCADRDLCYGPPGSLDADGDGLCDPLDTCWGVDLTGDTDGDGTCDGQDLCFGDDATGDDDNDGRCGDMDLCWGTDLTGDSDGDGVCDAEDLCLGSDQSGDDDGDAVCNDRDVCYGDSSEPDYDRDGVCGEADPCPAIPDHQALDLDLDGRGDLCDLCPTVADTLVDADDDALLDACDPCPGLSGEGQLDLDLDGVCDLSPADLCRGPDPLGDADADGWCDAQITRLSRAGSALHPGVSATDPSLVFSPASRRALVLWEERADTTAELWLSVLRADHKPLVPPFQLTRWRQRFGGYQQAGDPAIAVRDADGTALVAFRAGSLANTELWTMPLGPDGLPLSAPVQVSETGGPSDTRRSARQPALAYNADDDEFLLVHVAAERVHAVPYGTYGGLRDDAEEEIYALRLDGRGRPITGEQRQISATDGEPAHTHDASQPAVVWHGARRRYVVVHQARRHGQEDVLVTRLDAHGAPQGSAALVNPPRSTETYDATAPKLALSESAGVLLVVWSAEVRDRRDKIEVFGRLLDHDARPFGPSFRVSHTGPDHHVTANALDPDVLWDEEQGAFVVVWSAQPGSDGLAPGKREVFRQLVRVDGTLALPRDERQAPQPDPSPARDALRPTLAYNPLLRQPLLVFLSDDGSAGAADDSFGVWTPLLPPGPDGDGDGVRDELDLCAGPDDLDGDGWIACDPTPALRDCADLYAAIGRDLDGDGLCLGADRCPLDADNDADQDQICDNVDRCVGDNQSGDADQDGLCDDLDPCPTSEDLDDDGLCDHLDLCFGDDSTGDSDLDGTCDSHDHCPGDNRLDTDLDGTPDGCDPCPLDPGDDLDGDSTCDSLDLCVGDDSLGDSDLDGTCDDRDPCLGDDLTGDSDLDGLCDDRDLCFGDDTTGDSDLDGLCDDRDLCHGPGLAPDLDGDGTCDDRDLCLGWPDAYTRDTDLDGIGDRCDLCPLLASTDRGDVDGDGLGDPCDPCPGSRHLRQGDLDLDGTCDVEPDDLCYGPDELGDANADGLCDAMAVQVSPSTVTTPSSYVPHLALAWSPTSRRYLAVWPSSRDEHGQPLDATELWGRAIDPLGHPLGPAIWLSRTPGPPSKQVRRPVIAWNHDDDTFLVVYADAAGPSPALAALLVDHDARPLGGPRPLPAPSHPLESDDSRRASLLYNPVRQLFELYYTAPDPLGADGALELRWRELDRTGAPLGATDQRLLDSSPQRHHPDLAWSERRRSAMVVYAAPGEVDHVLGELRDAHGRTQVSAVQLSQNGPGPGQGDRARVPSVAYSEATDRYLVAWESNDEARNRADGYQVSAVLLDGTRRQLSEQLQLTFSRSATPVFAYAYEPEVVWHGDSDEFVVYFRGRTQAPSGAVANAELYAARVSVTGVVQPIEQVTTSHASFGGHGVVSFTVAHNPLLRDDVVLFTSAHPARFATSEHGIWFKRHGELASPDTDLDGVIDPLDRCAGPDDADGDGFVSCVHDCDDHDPTTADDLDADGLCDTLEPCFGDPSAGDSDGDGVCDDRDACPGPDAYDLDFDGLPDACDPCPTEYRDDGDPTCAALDRCAGDDRSGDSDGDGTCDDRDPCPLDNPDDADLDGLCTAADLCAGDDATGDADLDGLCDDRDRCLGDDATGDADRDGTCNDRDPCYGDQSFGDSDNDRICDTPLDTQDLFAPGQPLRLRLRNAPAGAQAFLLFTRNPTPGPPICYPGAADACTRFRDRVVVGRVDVNGTGQARWTMNVPGAVPAGATGFFQAVWVDTAHGRGDSSNVLQLTAP